MLDINLKQLEAFVTTVEHASFTRAAEILYLTQSTVSSHIGALEAQLNLRLIQRGARRKVELTPEGRDIYHAAKDILARCQTLQNMAQGSGNHQLLIGASSAPGQYLLPEILSRFLAENPDCRYSLIQGDSALIHQLLNQGQVRIGFASAAYDRKQYRYYPLIGDKLVLIAANTPVFRQEQASGATGRDLLKMPMILREESSGTRQALETCLYRWGIPMETLNTVALINNADAVKASVIRGLGVSVVSEMSVREDVAAGRLLSFDLEDEGIFQNIYLVVPRDTTLSAPEQKFVDCVLQRFPQKQPEPVTPAPCRQLPEP